MAFHRPRVVVYDGNALPPGLVQALAGRPDVGLIWIRRAMWGTWNRAGALQNIAAQKACDLVIEPAELAAERDRGATATSRGCVPDAAEFARVPPIRHLDPEDVLPRDEARRTLGLGAGKTVLVSFGAGTYSDHHELTDDVLTILKRFGDLQIVVARHVLSDSRPPHWDGVETIDAFPLSRFFRAFDAVIASAGYNTFHELMQLRVPTLFIPVEAEGMDSQLDRARWAAERGLALALRRSELDRLPTAVTKLLAGLPRVEGDDSGAGPNGADDAAALVTKMARNYDRWPSRVREAGPS